jgi:hypothetical protein
MTDMQVPSIGEVNAQHLARWIDSARAAASTQLPADTSGEGRQFQEVEAVVTAEEARGRVVRAGLSVTRI